MENDILGNSLNSFIRLYCIMMKKRLKLTKQNTNEKHNEVKYRVIFENPDFYLHDAVIYEQEEKQNTAM